MGTWPKKLYHFEKVYKEEGRLNIRLLKELEGVTTPSVKLLLKLHQARTFSSQTLSVSIEVEHFIKLKLLKYKKKSYRKFPPLLFIRITDTFPI